MAPVKDADGKVLWEHRWAHPQGDVDYYEAGHLDSLGYILLIEDIEHHFGFVFIRQDRRMNTIAGLAEVIGEHLQPR